MDSFNGWGNNAHRVQSLHVPPPVGIYADVDHDLQGTRYVSGIDEACDTVRRTRETERAFESVKEKWQSLTGRAGFDQEQVGEYRVEWERLSESFSSIALDTCRTAIQVTLVMDEFSDCFSGSRKRDDRTSIEQKQERLDNFKKRFFGVGESQEQTSREGIRSIKANAGKVDRLRMDLLRFRSLLRLNGVNVKSGPEEEVMTLQAKIKELEEKVAKMESRHVKQSTKADDTVFMSTSLDSSQVISVPRGADNWMWTRQDGSRRPEGSVRVRQAISRVTGTGTNQHKEMWNEHMKSCEEQVASITDHLCSISSVWTSLHTDTVTFEMLIGLATSRDLQQDFFGGRAKSVIDMHGHLRSILLELSYRHLSDGQAGPPDYPAIPVDFVACRRSPSYNPSTTGEGDRPPGIRDSGVLIGKDDDPGSERRKSRTLTSCIERPVHPRQETRNVGSVPAPAAVIDNKAPNPLSQIPTLADLAASEERIQLIESRHQESLEEARELPKRIAAIRTSFRTVQKYWKNANRGFDKEAVRKYYAEWRELGETFEAIVRDVHCIAAKGARRIKDFADDFCTFLGNKDGSVTLDDKRRELVRFKEALFADQSALFGHDSKNMYELTNRIMRLQNDVHNFEFEISIRDFPGKEELLREIESLERELSETKLAGLDNYEPIRDNRVQGLRSGVATVLGLFSGDKEVLDTLIEVSKARHGHDNRDNANARRLRKKIAEKKSTVTVREHAWGEHTQNCGEQIDQIASQLIAISNLWTALCSDLVELETQLDIITRSETHEELFHRRLETTQRLYRLLYELLVEVTHVKVLADEARPTTPRNDTTPKVLKKLFRFLR